MLLACSLAGICVISSWMLYKDMRLQLAGRAYVLQNQVSHARLLPVESKHSFVYPTLSLLLSLDALENKHIHLLGGWLFSYGGIWGRVTGLRASAYLYDSPRDDRSIKQKLQAILDERGFVEYRLQDAWLMTMPSFMGFEGINPLTVYFCYRQESSSLWLVVLEVHNTFGERNVHVLEVGKGEDAQRSPGFDHQWTFPRQFHVSPFNDRSGHYICQITAPSHPPLKFPSDGPLQPPRPIVKITLLTAPPHVQTKLIAILRPTWSTHLSSANLLKALASAPFGLLLAFPRIVYQAFLLHYHKRLNVYQRPEPRAPDPTVEVHLPVVQNSVQPTQDPVGGGIGWQREGTLERWCKHRVHTFLRRRCTETGVSVTLVSANHFEGRMTISPSELDESESLTIYYRSPRLFTTIFMMPSPKHALLFGSQAERIFSVSSEEMFSRIFAARPPMSSQLHRRARLARDIRTKLVPDSIEVPIPLLHPLDDPLTFMPVFVLSMLWILKTLEEKVFRALGARFVPGDEPWAGWQRLRSLDLPLPGGELGSVRSTKD